MSVNSKKINAENEISQIANITNKELTLRGYWFFQLKKDINQKYKLLEVSTRLVPLLPLCWGCRCIYRPEIK